MSLDFFQISIRFPLVLSKMVPGMGVGGYVECRETHSSLLIGALVGTLASLVPTVYILLLQYDVGECTVLFS